MGEMHAPNIRGRTPVQHGRERHGGAVAECADVEAAQRGRQQPHIGEHGEAAPDAGVVVEVLLFSIAY